MIGRFLVLLIASIHFAGWGAQSIEDQFREANRLYEQGNFSQAASGYQNIIAAGKVSAALYFNLGNAHFKAGEVGEAIAAYSRANKLAPRDNAIRSNLRLARQKAGESSPIAAKGFWSRLSLNEWTAITAFFAALFFVLLAVKQLKPKFRILWPVSLAALLAVGSGVGLAASAQQTFFVKTSVVVVPEAAVRRGPFEESAAAFSVREGAELTIVDRQGDWLQVTDSRNRAGWIPREQVIEI